MKLLKYIWRNVTRNKLRSGLTILSVAFSLALMTILYGYLAMQNVSEREAAKHDRIAVLNKLGFAAILPIAYVDRISRMDGVIAATPFSWFGGNYKNQQDNIRIILVVPCFFLVFRRFSYVFFIVSNDYIHL